MNTRRLYGPVVLGTLAAGGLAFYAASRTWAYAQVRAEGLPTDRVAVTGSTAQPAVPALALVVVTAALAVLASSPRVRRFVGLFTVLVAVGGLFLLALGRSSVNDEFERAVAASPAFTGSNAPSPQHTIWVVVAAVSLAAAALCGALTARFGPGWPTMGSQYEAPQARAATAQASDDMWKAFDDGNDPTQ